MAGTWSAHGPLSPKLRPPSVVRAQVNAFTERERRVLDNWTLCREACSEAEAAARCGNVWLTDVIEALENRGLRVDVLADATGHQFFGVFEADKMRAVLHATPAGPHLYPTEE